MALSMELRRATTTARGVFRLPLLTLVGMPVLSLIALVLYTYWRTMFREEGLYSCSRIQSRWAVVLAVRYVAADCSVSSVIR